VFRPHEARGHGRAIGLLVPTSDLAEPLDRERILAGLPPASREALVRLDLYGEADSTNQVLLDRAAEGSIHRHVCLAEFQRAGRGRHGRPWVMPRGAGVCLSMGWRFAMPLQHLAALSLACGVIVMRAFRAIGIHGAGLKWPNDVLWQRQKLGGILVEMKGSPEGSQDAVIGIGLNVAFPEADIPIVQPWTDLAALMGHPVSRNDLAAQLIHQLLEALPVYKQQGFAAFLEEWRAYHAMEGRHVTLSLPNGKAVEGEIQDIDAEGALVLSVNGGRRRFLAGEISLRTIS